MNLIAKIGQNPIFITWMAHMFFAYAIVYTFHAHWIPLTVIAIAAVKEFYFDKHFETGQTFMDNLIDFAGYTSGVLLALAARAWL